MLFELTHLSIFPMQGTSSTSFIIVLLLYGLTMTEQAI